MTRTPVPRELFIIILSFLIMLPAAGCNSTNATRLGELRAPLTGDWAITPSLQPEDTCTSGGPIVPISQYLRIVQTGGSLTASQIDCCIVAAVGSGTVEGENFTLTLTRNLAFPPDIDCIYQLNEQDVGKIVPEGFSADAVVQVTKTGTCSNPAPCTIQAHIEGRRCDFTGCIMCEGILCPL